LLAADLAHGWSETSRIAMLGLFEDLRRCLRSPEPLAEKYKSLNISPGMDSWGITGGDMLEEAAEISIGLGNAELGCGHGVTGTLIMARLMNAGIGL